MIKTIFSGLLLLGKLGAVKNWKTTAVGLIGAIAIAIFDDMNRGVMDWQTWVKVGVTAALGFLAKDADVTGGVKPAIEDTKVSEQ